MMRTSIILGVIALGLLGYIVFVERGSLSQGELEKRQSNVLPEFIRDRVTKIEIQRHNVTTVIEKRHDDELDADYWSLVSPLSARADQDAVDTLLGELEWMETRRRFSEISAEDRKRFGLDAPRFRVWFTVADQRVLVVVGGESPQGDGVYLTTKNSKATSAAFVVGKDLVEALDHEPAHYYTKELHEGISRYNVRSLALREPTRQLRVARGQDHLWRFVSPKVGLASYPVIEEVLKSLDHLRASRFISERASDEHGFSTPSFALELVRETTLDGAAPDAGEKGEKKEQKLETLSFVAGAACSGHQGETYLRAEADGPVMCVLDEDLKKLQKSLDDLREARLLPLEERGVTALTVGQGGTRLSVELQEDDSWKYRMTRGEKVVAEGTAREGSVTDWLKALRETRALTYTSDPSSAVAEDAANVRLTAKRGTKGEFELVADLKGLDGVRVRRADEPNLVVFPQSAAELLQPMAARFRALELVSRNEAELRSLTVQRAKGRERVVRGEGADARPALEEPVKAPAERSIVEELARQLAHLTAVRFVADAPAPEHGLGTEALRVDATFEGDKKGEVRLLIGAETQGGRFAALDGQQAVFVVPNGLADKLSAPLIDRAVLATPLEGLQGASVERAGRKVELRRTEGETFELGEGKGDAAKARALAEAIATLRATQVAEYEAQDRGHGFDRPYARLAISPRGGPAYELLIGAESEAGSRYARRSDYPVTFELPAAQVTALMAPFAATSGAAD